MQRAVRYLLVVLIIAGLSVGGFYVYRLIHQSDIAQNGQVDPNTAKPVGKLVVLVVFDQMRGDYISRWAPQFSPSGFERMKKEGVWFSMAEIPYACTSTGPGHASIATGAPPSVTGIIENEWFDRKTHELVYCVQPEPSRPYAMVPPIASTDAKASRGSELGFSPERLLAETVGDKLKAVSGGKGKVISISIKDRTAVLMGGKHPDAVYCFDTRDGRFHTGAYYSDHTHPWLPDYTTEFWQTKFDKPWELFNPKLDYKALTGNIDEAPGEDRGISQGRSFPHPMNGGLKGVGPKFFEAVETSPLGNEMLFDLAKKAIEGEKLGTGETADLLCVSFSSNDLIGHRWGPDSWEVLDITLRSDKLIGDLLAYLDSSLGKDRYTLVITADHGVCPIPEQEQEKSPGAQRVKLSDPEVKLFQNLSEALDFKFGNAPSGRTQWFEQEDAKEMERLWPWIYLNHKAIEARRLKVDEVANVVRDWIAGRSFIQTAFTSQQIESGQFTPEDMNFGNKARLAYHPDRCGDVIAIPKAKVIVTPYGAGTTHGSPHPYDSHVPILAIGSGIPAVGERTQKVSSLVVAPILARALSIDPPANAVEKVLEVLGK
jgi:hypothetical protein